jgi:hypothetical protein
MKEGGPVDQYLLNTVECDNQCCGSGMFIPDPNFFHPGSRIRMFSIPDPGSRIRIKEFKYFCPKKWFISSWKYDSGYSSRIQIPDPDHDFLSNPDPGVKKLPDPGSGSATLVTIIGYLTEITQVLSHPKKRGGALKQTQ